MLLLLPPGFCFVLPFMPDRTHSSRSSVLLRTAILGFGVLYSRLVSCLSLGRWCPDPRTAIIVLLRIPERIDCVRIRPIPNIHHFHPPNYFEPGHTNQPLEMVVAL